MRLYYIAEAEGRHRHVRSALGGNAASWNDFFREVRHWRLRLRDRYGAVPAVALQPCHVLTLREPLDGDGGGGPRPHPPRERSFFAATGGRHVFLLFSRRVVATAKPNSAPARRAEALPSDRPVPLRLLRSRG